MSLPSAGAKTGAEAQTKAEARSELATLPGITPQWIEERLSALPD